MNKKTLFLILLVGVLIPAFACAQNTLNDIVTSVARELGVLGAGLATIAFIVSGIMYLTATGKPERISIAKASLLAAVIGIVIIILSSGAEGFIKSIFFNAG